LIQLALSARAKINLGLRILRKRDDGYHDIITRFQRISLADIVFLHPFSSGVEYNGPALTERPEQNLVWRAATGFIKEFGGGGVAVALTKCIPAGAGLGGGASDAASTLLGLARMNNVNPDNPRLLAIAAELGADVPFFMLDSPSAIGEGKGERLSIAKGLPESRWVSVLWPGFEISTARAYQERDNALTPPIIDNNFKIRLIPANEDCGTCVDYINDFEPVVFAAHPELKTTRDDLLHHGAISAGLGGSGSSLFAIFDSEAKARAAITRRSEWLGFVCRPC